MAHRRALLGPWRAVECPVRRKTPVNTPAWCGPLRHRALCSLSLRTRPATVPPHYRRRERKNCVAGRFLDCFNISRCALPGNPLRTLAAECEPGKPEAAPPSSRAAGRVSSCNGRLRTRRRSLSLNLAAGGEQGGAF
ncbi:hypothetical protein MRX96_019189 [Rhipicephalus microplus]